MKRIMFLVIFLLLPGLASATVEIDGNEVSFTWETENATDGEVMYGTEDLSYSKTGEADVKSHSITIGNLEYNTEYYYKLKNCNATDCTKSEMESFTTGQVPAADEDMFLEVYHEGQDVPVLYNDDEITLKVSSLPGADVFVRVNGELKRRAILGDSGNFTFESISGFSKGRNEINITADYEGEVKRLDQVIEVDMTPPEVEISEIPSMMTESSLLIKGNVSENVSVDIRVDSESVNGLQTDDNFSQEVNFADGERNLELVFTDKAGNEVKEEYDISVYTGKVKLDLDESIDSLSPAYVDKVRIKGKTEPGAKVVVYVNGETLARKSWQLSLSSLIKQFGTLVKDKDKEMITRADEDGNFVVDAHLSQDIEYEDYEGQRYTNIEEDDTRTREFTTVPAWKNNIKVVSIGHGNRTSDPVEGEVKLTTCDYGGDWNFNVIGSISPNILNPDLIKEGMASLGINYELEWQGLGEEEDAKIIGSKPEIRVPSERIRQSFSDDDKDYRIGERLVDSSGILHQFSRDALAGSIKVNLGNNPKDLSEYDNVKFVLKMEIDYEYSRFGETRTGRQIKCIPVSVPIDKKLEDEWKPKSLLKSGIKLMDWVKNVTKESADVVQDVKKVAFYTAIGTNVAHFIAKAKEKISCMGYKGVGKYSFIPHKSKEEGDGNALVEPGSNKCTTHDEKDKDCSGCWEAIKSTEKMEKINRWASDRIFCPAVPSVFEFARRSQSDPYYYYEVDGEKEIRAEPGCPGNESEISKDDEECESHYLEEWRSGCTLVGDLYSYSFREKNMSFFENLVDTVEGVCQENEYSQEIIHKKDDCCKEHSFTEDTETRGNDCFYVLNPEGLPKGIYEARFNQETMCKTKPDDPDSCVKDDEGNYVIDPAKSYSSIEIMGKNSGNAREHMVFNPANYTDDGSDHHNSVKEEMKDRCLTHYTVGEENKNVIDPTGGFFSSIQCGCLPAMEKYLRNYQKVAGMTSQCFKTVLTNENVTSGMCKSVMSQYVCDLIYNAIRCGGKFFSKQSLAPSGSTEARDGLGVGEFFGALNEAGEDVAHSVSNRYQSTTMYQWMFSEKQLLHSACMGAFTGKWDMQMENLLSSASEKMAVESDVMLMPGKRRFNTYSPVNGRATHIYTVSYGIVAGSDMSYKVDLVCSAENTCNYEGRGGKCDCYDSGEEKAYSTGITGNLKSGGTISKERHIEVSDSKVRYDTVRLTYTYRNNENEEVSKTVEKPINKQGGSPPVCSFDADAGAFLCDFKVSDRGYASFGDRMPRLASVSGRGNYKVNENVLVEGEIIKKSPEDDPNKQMYLLVNLKDGDAERFNEKVSLRSDQKYDLKDIFRNEIDLRMKSDWFSQTNEFEGNGVEAYLSGELDRDVDLVFENAGDGANVTIRSYEDIDTNNKACKETEKNEYECPYEDRFSVNVGDAEITIRGTPRAGGEGGTDIGEQIDRIKVKSSGSNTKDFTLELSLHYASEDNPDKIDYQPIVQDGKKQKQTLRVTGVSTLSSDKPPCSSKYYYGDAVPPDAQCQCGTGDDGELCEGGDYCYDGRCEDIPPCIEYNEQGDEASDYLIDHSYECFCGEEDIPGSTDARDEERMYCYEGEKIIGKTDMEDKLE
ncbi:MAG: fibronectin type III domain-containing protein [Nanobdellota archaeon]